MSLPEWPANAEELMRQELGENPTREAKLAWVTPRLRQAESLIVQGAMEAYPDYTVAELAAELDMTEARVREICTEMGLFVQRFPR
jgi:predicted transcriptional regulator